MSVGLLVRAVGGLGVCGRRTAPAAGCWAGGGSGNDDVKGVVVRKMLWGASESKKEGDNS